MGDSSTVADNFFGYSGIRKWTVWSVILAGTSLLVLGISVLMPEHIDVAMYLVICVLGLITMVSSFRIAMDIHRETQRAGRQVSLLEEVSSFEEFLYQTRKQPSAFRTHIANLYEMMSSHHEVSQDHLIQILQSRMRASNRVNDLFASILTTLGLIGTIIGLLLMMNALSQQVLDADGDAQALMSSLFDPDTGGALSGLGVAFITTLLGAVLGGIILRVLTCVVDANITQYVALVAELTEVYVLPTMRALAELPPSARPADMGPVRGDSNHPADGSRGGA